VANETHPAEQSAPPEPAAETAPAEVVAEEKAPVWAPDKIERWPIARLKVDPRNARVHESEDVEQLRGWIKEFGFVKPIFARENGMIVAGHGRRIAALLEGLSWVPVIVVPAEWSDQKCREYALIDNQSALLSKWDDTLRGAEIGELVALGTPLEKLGFPKADLRKLGLVASAPKAPKLEEVIKEIFQVLVECETEAQQLSVLTQLQEAGIKCRALIA
jgi:ParB-like nuclease domain